MKGAIASGEERGRMLDFQVTHFRRRVDMSLRTADFAAFKQGDDTQYAQPRELERKRIRSFKVRGKITQEEQCLWRSTTAIVKTQSLGF